MGIVRAIARATNRESIEADFMNHQTPEQPRDISHNITASQKKFLAYATAIAIILGAWFLSGYFTMFIFAGILAYLFHPFYTRLKKKRSSGSAAAITLVVSLLIVIVPVVLILWLAARQLTSSVDTIGSYFENLDTTEISTRFINTINAFLDTLPFSVEHVTEESIIESLKNFAQSIADNIVSFLASTASSAISAITSFIIYLYVFISLLRNGETIIDIFKKLNPLGEQISDRYLSGMGAMVKGTVSGQFIIATLQGFLGATAFAIAGYPEFFFVLFLVFTLFSIIPLGAGILIIPLGMLMIIFGNVWGGVLVIGEHLLINTNIDNILRPILVPKQARLDSALMLVSVFSGIHFFGFLGIVVGPTLMIIITTTVKAYLEVHKDYRSPVAGGGTNKHFWQGWKSRFTRSPTAKS